VIPIKINQILTKTINVGLRQKVNQKAGQLYSAARDQ